MGFTIEDMNLFAKDRYHMEFIAGKNGWSNSISWILVIEDMAILHNFRGRELAVTTGFGFAEEHKQRELVEKLVEHHVAGLVINVGEYIKKIPDSIVSYCDENDLPLMAVPWEVYLVDMIKDLSIRIFLQGTTDEEITRAFIHAIEQNENQEYRKDLLAYFDVEGEFQVILFTADGFAEMDTVERKRLGYRLQIYLENITHNGSFFYYDGHFVLIMNDVSDKDSQNILEGMLGRAKRRMPDKAIYVGAGSKLKDLDNLHIGYKRAKAAVAMAKREKKDFQFFDKMGMQRLLYSVTDTALLQEMGEDRLRPLIEYDKKHNGSYVETLEWYLKLNGSIQAVAEVMYTHRNTVIYRITNIKKLLNSELETTEERLEYQLAYSIRNARLAGEEDI